MILIALIAIPIAALAMKFGAEDRPGFDERSPLN
jgi:hypothetical protein